MVATTTTTTVHLLNVRVCIDAELHHEVWNDAEHLPTMGITLGGND